MSISSDKEIEMNIINQESIINNYKLNEYNELYDELIKYIPLNDKINPKLLDKLVDDEIVKIFSISKIGFGLLDYITIDYIEDIYKDLTYEKCKRSLEYLFNGYLDNEKILNKLYKKCNPFYKISIIENSFAYNIYVHQVTTKLDNNCLNKNIIISQKNFCFLGWSSTTFI